MKDIAFAIRKTKVFIETMKGVNEQYINPGFVGVVLTQEAFDILKESFRGDKHFKELENFKDGDVLFGLQVRIEDKTLITENLVTITEEEKRDFIASLV